MKIDALLILSLLGLTACQGMSGGTAPAASGGSAGALGEGYCETEPADPADLDHWNDVCMADTR